MHIFIDSPHAAFALTCKNYHQSVVSLKLRQVHLCPSDSTRSMHVQLKRCDNTSSAQTGPKKPNMNSCLETRSSNPERSFQTCFSLLEFDGYQRQGSGYNKSTDCSKELAGDVERHNSKVSIMVCTYEVSKHEYLTRPFLNIECRLLHAGY